MAFIHQSASAGVSVTGAGDAGKVTGPMGFFTAVKRKANVAKNVAENQAAAAAKAEEAAAALATTLKET
jgi:hypothetical protein